MKGKKMLLWTIAVAFLLVSPAKVRAAEIPGQITTVAAGYDQGNKVELQKKDEHIYQGGCKINGKVYVFDEQGHILKNKKNKMVTVLGDKYYITNKKGNPATGYFVYRNNLYYADKTGRCVTDRTREKGKYYFTASGSAKKNTYVLLKIQAMQTLSKITNSKMTRSQKLKACWNYTTDREIMRYGGTDPNLKKKGWYNETALKMLKSKLMEIKQREKLDKIDDIKGVKTNIEWGAQIRSYVFMPYTLVKDTRTGYEDGNIQAVMDGDLDGFINAYLKMNAGSNK